MFCYFEFKLSIASLRISILRRIMNVRYYVDSTSCKAAPQKMVFIRTLNIRCKFLSYYYFFELKFRKNKL